MRAADTKPEGPALVIERRKPRRQRQPVGQDSEQTSFPLASEPEERADQDHALAELRSLLT